MILNSTTPIPLININSNNIKVIFNPPGLIVARLLYRNMILPSLLTIIVGYNHGDYSLKIYRYTYRQRLYLLYQNNSGSSTFSSWFSTPSFFSGFSSSGSGSFLFRASVTESIDDFSTGSVVSFSS